MSELSGRIANLTPKQRALLELRRAEAAGTSKAAVEPIAVIGIGCRFPGSVTGPEAFWQLLKQGRDAITEVPKDRWDIDAFYDPDPDAPGKMYTRWGGFIDNVDRFDPRFFGIAPREAASMDPQQRLLLEVAWEALEDAGLPPSLLNGTRTGIFAGLMTTDYSLLNMANYDPELVDIYSGSGVDHSFAAGRLSYVLGLQGPSMVVATACSSALVATHLACQSLRAGDCQLALAGGVNVILSPEATIYSCRIRSMAPDGRCKTFDASADGYVRGEGCGIVVLKRLADAVRDGDNILALIRGSAINHDGRSAGLTVPNVAAQQAVIRTALANGGVLPQQVGYVEAHGTGTPLGDPIEIRALWSVLGPGRKQPLMVGSAKTNVGHLEAASGMVGLIKTILALRHRQIPPHLHLNARSPYIDWAQMHIDIPTACVDWTPEAGPRLAGVSSFGLSGMNAHIVLEEAPRDPAIPDTERRNYLLPVSARSTEALASLKDVYAAILGRPGVSIYDLCYSAAVRRSHLEERVIAAGANAEELRTSLEAPASPRLAPAGQKAPLAFVFPGQGGQCLHMGHGLFSQEPVFRQSIEACDLALRPYADWSLVPIIEGDNDDWLDQIDRVQPAIFAVQVALAALWRSWGIVPDCVIGHSMGEVAAAHVAGILSLDDAIRIIARRSGLLKTVRGQGAMLLAELSLEDAARAIAKRRGLSIAANNGPRSTVVAGPEDALAEWSAELEQSGVFFRRLQVNVAAHTAQVEPLEAALRQALSGLAPGAGLIPFYSTVSGELQPGEGCDAAYWISNLRQPVQFWNAAQRVFANGCRLFVEVSPHPVLSASIDDGLKFAQLTGQVLPSLRRGEDDSRVMLQSLGNLYLQGHAVEWRNVYGQRAGHCPLPTYPWNRERYWLDTSRAKSRRSGKRTVLGERREIANHPGTYAWDLDLDLATCPYLADHRVEGIIVVPAAVYIAVAVEAAASISQPAVRTLLDLEFKQVLVIADQGAPQLQLVLDHSTFQFASRANAAQKWTIHATGRIGEGAPGPQPVLLPEIRERCQEVLSGDSYYEALGLAGLEYGPAFRGITELRRGEGESLAELREVAKSTASGVEARIHPALLDAAFQSLGAALSGLAGPALPVGIAKFQIVSRPPGALLGWTRMTAELEGQVTLLNEQGAVFALADGFRVQSLEQSTPGRDPIDEWMYTIGWQPAELAAPPVASTNGLWLILPDRQGLAENAASLLQAAGEQVRLGTRETVAELVQSGQTCRGVLYLAGLDEPAPMAVVELVKTLSNSGWRDMPRLYVVTSGAVSTAPAETVEALDQAPLWGLSRTLALEHSEFACTRIDVQLSELESASRMLVAELLAAGPEDQIAFRGDARFVARLVRYTHTGSVDTPALQPAGDRPFRLEIDAPGILENLTLRAATREPVRSDEVEIDVRAAGLNFLDVLAAMGIRPDTVEGPIALGGECAGIVTAAGAEVTGLQPGDAVIAIAPYCFGTHVRTKATLVVPKPSSLSFAEGAAIPIASLTAYYALVHQGRLQAGERILIHSASGGTGLAAVQIAKHLGAEVFATAGTPEKRRFLQSLGVAHTMDSRSLAFAEEVRTLTGGRGVDVVLNSLTGEAIAASISALAPYGRFLEIGKRDIYEGNQLSLWPFQQNLSYFAIDLARMIVERTGYVRQMLLEVVALYANGALGPVAVETRPIGGAIAAFHSMANAQHIGKIVLTTESFADTPVAPLRTDQVRLRADGTYLITGGLGGLGLVVAEWLAGQGAGHVVLVGRSAPGDHAITVIDRLRASGTQVTVAAADIAQRDQLARVFEQIPAGKPLRGIFHAAAVLEDGTILRLEAEQFLRVGRPKIDGARNLADLCADISLDHFVLFSSAASVMGSPGQANYAAANAYLDALAQQLRAHGKPAISINWGPWSEVGLAAAQSNRGERLATQGMASISPSQGLIALGRLLARSNAAQVAVMPLNLRHWRQLFPGATRAPFLAQLMSESHLSEPGQRAAGPERKQLMETPPTLRQALLEDMLRTLLARVLRMPPEQIDPATPLTSLGLDSLMGLELRNRLELSFGVTLSATLIFGYPTIRALAPYLAEKMGIPFEEDPPAAAAITPMETNRAAAVAELSEEDAEALLAEKLAGLNLEDLS